MADYSDHERLARVDTTLDGMLDLLRSIDARILSLENWVRMLTVPLMALVAGVAVQITLTLVKG